ncbi:unnamed protein product [marine sediment metagenome]|uniref:OmpA-like domain-containing protein n=1 Tax=marine sediment metagenome TaxID=412755 RepID=X1DBH4_9ZZZZ
MTIILEGIKFDFNKATIKPESELVLHNAVTILTNHPDIKVEIQGHTDSVGRESYNLKLSQARADAVREYLIRFRNIDSGRLIARGYGEQQPIASNLTEEGRNLNRRVEFLILK